MGYDWVWLCFLHDQYLVQFHNAQSGKPRKRRGSGLKRVEHLASYTPIISISSLRNKMCEGCMKARWKVQDWCSLMIIWIQVKTQQVFCSWKNTIQSPQSFLWDVHQCLLIRLTAGSLSCGSWWVRGAHEPWVGGCSRVGAGNWFPNWKFHWKGYPSARQRSISGMWFITGHLSLHRDR